MNHIYNNQPLVLTFWGQLQILNKKLVRVSHMHSFPSFYSIQIIFLQAQKIKIIKIKIINHNSCKYQPNIRTKRPCLYQHMEPQMPGSISNTYAMTQWLYILILMQSQVQTHTDLDTQKAHVTPLESRYVPNPITLPK